MPAGLNHEKILIDQRKVLGDRRKRDPSSPARAVSIVIEDAAVLIVDDPIRRVMGLLCTILA
jgi:hypothetical protein